MSTIHGNGGLVSAKRIPNEIWDEILTIACFADSREYTLVYHMSDEQENTIELPPLNFSQVCSQWRTVAQTRPELWTAIAVDVFQPIHDIRPLLKIYFGNSRNLPLMIYIRAYPLGVEDELPGLDFNPKDYLGELGFTTFEMLLQQAPRCYDLTLELLSGRILSSHNHPEISFPVLREFRNEAMEDAVADGTRWFWDGILKATALNVVYLETAIVPIAIPYFQLTILSFNIIYSDDFEHLCRTLRWCNKLESLYLKECDFLENESPIDVTLPSLRQLLIGSSSMKRLDPILNSLVTPILVHLEVDFQYPESKNTNALNDNTMEWTPISVKNLIERSACADTLEVLMLLLPRYAYITPQSLSSLLEMTPNLQSLHTSFQTRERPTLNLQNLFSTLTISYSESPVVLVPKLRTLRAHQRGADANQDLSDAIRGLLTSRYKRQLDGRPDIICLELCIIDIRDQPMDHVMPREVRLQVAENAVTISEGLQSLERNGIAIMFL